MGLKRVERVRAELGIVPSFPVITVAGTNGKGSTCAMMEAILNRAGYHTGCYTSPHQPPSGAFPELDFFVADCLCHLYIGLPRA